jgi:hypothetical protein
MRQLDKKSVKAVFDYFRKVANRKYKTTFELIPSFQVSVEYFVYWYDSEFDFDVNDYKSKLSGDLAKLRKTLDYDFSEHILDDLDFSEYINLGEIQNKFDTLLSASGLDEDDMWIFEEEDETSFAEIWDYLIKGEDNKSQRIYLNSEYDAVIDKKNKTVKVGCQTIPIENVRKIIEVYDS